MSSQGETAFLTGGASGIGRAVTTFLVGKGIKVFVGDRDSKGLEDLSTSLNKDTDQRIWTSQVDVADWDSQRTAFEKALEVFDGRLDYVLPIAGIGERRSFPNRPNSTGFEKPDLSVVEVDEIGVIYTAWLAVQHFRRQTTNQYGWKGKIIPVASICGFYIHTPIPLYTAAKHAVVGFVRSYGKILLEEDIFLNAVCPNKIRTNIGTAASYEKAEKAGCLVPMEKLLEAFEMLLAKEGEYSHVSGECLEVAPKLGVRLAPKAEFVNEESRISAQITYERSHYLHEVVE